MDKDLFRGRGKVNKGKHEERNVKDMYLGPIVKHQDLVSARCCCIFSMCVVQDERLALS